MEMPNNITHFVVTLDRFTIIKSEHEVSKMIVFLYLNDKFAAYFLFFYIFLFL